MPYRAADSRATKLTERIAERMTANQTIPRERQAYDQFTPVTIRFSDQDAMGHVNNVATAAFFESGRFGFFDHLFAEGTTPWKNMILASVSIDYLREILFPGVVEIGGRLARLGDRSMTTHYAIFKDGDCCAVSQAVTVFFDPVKRTSAAPEPQVRARLEAYLADNPTAG